MSEIANSSVSLSAMEVPPPSASTSPSHKESDLQTSSNHVSQESPNKAYQSVVAPELPQSPNSTVTRIAESSKVGLNPCNEI